MLSYAICVCNEVKEIRILLTFLEEVRNKDTTEIVVLVDSTKSTKKLVKCLATFGESIKVFKRDFDGDFAAHKNFLNSKCSGEFIFNIDADEVPDESLIRVFESIKPEHNFDLLYISRINICIGYNQAFLLRWKFQANELGWINWPDYQGRIYRNKPGIIMWAGKVHEKIVGGTYVRPLKQTPEPRL